MMSHDELFELLYEIAVVSEGKICIEIPLAPECDSNGSSSVPPLWDRQRFRESLRLLAEPWKS
jgi:hypothetical protein